MKRQILGKTLVAAIIAAGLSVGSLCAQQNGLGNRNSLSASSIASTGSAETSSIVQTAINNGQATGLAQFDSSAIPGLQQIAKLQAEASWGMSTIPLPNYLRKAELGLAPSQGWLVTQLVPGLPSMTSGVEIGSLIVEIDGQPALSNQPLPVLEGEHTLLVMCESGLKEVCVKPMAAGLLGSNPQLNQILNQASGLAQSIPNLATGSWAGLTVNPLNSQPTPRSLAVSQVNGELSVSAIVDSATGPTRVELRGNRAEIVQQLSRLPAEVQSQLAPHIGL